MHAPARWAVAPLCLLGAALAADEAWLPTTWGRDPAWAAEIGQATAIVAPSAGRLTWFGPRDGGNLLFIPDGGSIDVGGAALHGGHQVWLGPQARWTWPPAPGWEGAGTATVSGAEVILALPASAGLPALERTYRVDGATLVCGVRWRDPRGWQAMHVLQVPRDVRLAPLFAPAAAGRPNGCSFDVSGRDVLPAGCRREGDLVHVAPAPLPAKVFAPAQRLRASREGWALELDPVATHGREAGPAERGLPTQIYLSPTGMGYLELEQCSVLLEPAEDGWAGASFALRLVHEEER